MDTSSHPLILSVAPPASVQKRSRWGGRLVVAFLILMIGLVVAWYAGLRNRFIPDNFGVVVPGRIYRSAQINRHILRKTLEDHNITVIVDLAPENTADSLAERKISKEMGVQKYEFSLAGNGVGNPDVYPDAIKVIVDANRQGKAVLVHCQSGAQRTGGVIATYRMLVEGRPESQAIEEAKRFHHSPSNNPLLFQFVDLHLQEWKTRLEAEHVLSSN